MPNHLILDLPEKSIRPGQTVRGEILWDFEKQPKSISLNLGWWTSGRGDRDEAVLAERRWEAPARIGKEAFSFEVPTRIIPSFSGSLISVVWGLQLSVDGVPVDDIVEILTISPSGEEIDISNETYQSKGKSISF